MRRLPALPLVAGNDGEKIGKGNVEGGGVNLLAFIANDALGTWMLRARLAY
jgi:hypothetical protein